MPKRPEPTVPAEIIEQNIYLIRGHKVMLDRDLADLYRVKRIALRQQVKRNANRFLNDFVFQLTKQEAEMLVSQNVIPSRRSLGRISALCLHRAGCSHAFKCSHQRAGCSGKHCHHARFCQNADLACHPCRSAPTPE